MAISRDFWTNDINRLVQEAGDGATVCLKMTDGSRHYIRTILRTGPQEVETHSYLGSASGPFVASTSAMHVLETTPARFETRTFSLDNQLQVDIVGRNAEKHLRTDK